MPVVSKIKTKLLYTLKLYLGLGGRTYEYDYDPYYTISSQRLQ